MLIPDTKSLVNQYSKSIHHPKIEMINGNNMAITYIFNCGCELPSDYDHYYPLKNPCGNHDPKLLKDVVLNTDYWDLISLIG